MNLFIDTNIFLAFYHLTSDDLEELRKLGVLLRKSKLSLFIPGQVIDEFKRNRDNKIADALKRLKEQKLNLQFPQICKDYDEYKTLRECQKNYEKSHSELLKKLSQDIFENSLKADGIINDLFKSGTVIETTKEILDSSNIRYAIGNPPGKDGSLGDAINWESLLASISQKEDLYFITDDGDYCSSLDGNMFNSYLSEEWNTKKCSDLIYYKKLSNFFKDQFPDIKLASELEKELLIKDLASSYSFAQTHTVVSKLNKHADFTNSQTNDMVAAAVTNSQIWWILKDDDVCEFYSKIIDGKETKLEKNNLHQLMEGIGKKSQDDDQLDDDKDLPF
ncbi:PIN domain-containing protein [uncultured Desulfuromonas sp.]|uniref:PIN domain-containing protein n=1 Tax=uncultured Desulfuromonas sp. TaxID=181013 RepID=UPI00261F1BA9|nr:PIN domain-containing protein [uncultured Desulfuromonas sp.]